MPDINKSAFTFRREADEQKAPKEVFHQLRSLLPIAADGSKESWVDLRLRQPQNGIGDDRKEHLVPFHEHHTVSLEPIFTGVYSVVYGEGQEVTEE